MRTINLPLDEETVYSLRAGDTVLLSGDVYTARDMAHKRFAPLLAEGKALPFDPCGQVLYYAGPAPAREGQAVGPIGPTSSYRMDLWTPALLKAGLKGMIGKGLRGEAVIEAMCRYGAVYFGAVGGAAALLARHVTACEVIAYADLGTEAVRRLRVNEFPVTVLIDSQGNNLYVNGRAQWRMD